MQNFYVIEGTSNSGKSTTCELLRKIPGIVTIPEFMDHPNAPRPSKTVEEELRNQRIFLEIERERLEMARRGLAEGKTVFFERNFLSILAVSYAFQKMRKYSTFANAFELFEEMKKSSWYIDPETYFILSASYEEGLNRNKKRLNELNTSWIDSNFDNYQKRFYAIFSESVDNAISIDTSGQPKEFARDFIKGKINKR